MSRIFLELDLLESQRLFEVPPNKLLASTEPISRNERNNTFFHDCSLRNYCPMPTLQFPSSQPLSPSRLSSLPPPLLSHPRRRRYNEANMQERTELRPFEF